MTRSRFQARPDDFIWPWEKGKGKMTLTRIDKETTQRFVVDGVARNTREHAIESISRFLGMTKAAADRALAGGHLMEAEFSFFKEEKTKGEKRMETIRRRREERLRGTKPVRSLRPKRSPQCLLSVSNGHWCQESYETASRDAGRRARKLRLKGYDAVVSALGPQETRWGLIKLSMVTITPGTHSDLEALPNVDMVERPEFGIMNPSEYR